MARAATLLGAALTVLGLAPAPAWGQTRDRFRAAERPRTQQGAEGLLPKMAGGFLLLNGSLQSLPTAVAQSRSDYGLAGIVGVSAVGHPWERWEYVAYVTASVVTNAVAGTAGFFAPEQITISYRPVKDLSFAVGYQRIHFSLGQAQVIALSMFPTRPEPTALFHVGADAGLLASYGSEEGVVHVRAGVFDGLSLNQTFPGHTSRGPVLSVSLEIAPLGAMLPLEADFKGSPFRFALHAGVVHRLGTAYDPAGYRGVGFDDLRFALSARLAFRGLYAQGEYLEDIQSDDLSARRRLTRGAYGEVSYHVLVGKIGLAPLTRLAWSVQDASFFPLHTVNATAGLALYPRGDLTRRGSVRLVLQYLSERRVREAETAYGGLASVMTLF